MPEAEFFNQFGLYAVRDFLDPDFCASLCGEMLAGRHIAAVKINPLTGEEFSSKNKKRTDVSEIPVIYTETVSNKLLEQLSRIENHYGISLKNIQPPKFSIYKTGDFFAQHVDSYDGECSASPHGERKISAIIFLNEESQIEKAGAYTGGNLTFYGLVKTPAFKNYGMPLQSHSGMLITFPPDLVHEVTPVISGDRFTAITWFI